MVTHLSKQKSQISENKKNFVPKEIKLRNLIKNWGSLMLFIEILSFCLLVCTPLPDIVAPFWNTWLFWHSQNVGYVYFIALYSVYKMTTYPLVQDLYLSMVVSPYVR